MKMNTKLFIVVFFATFVAGCSLVLNPDPLTCEACLADGGPADGGDTDGGGDAGNLCIPDPCSGHGACSVIDGSVVCDCNLGWAGTACSACSAGYHDASGNCVLDQACLANSCGGHGTCTTPGGVVTCSCSGGYQPPFCGACATDYQDKDSNGTCLMACTNPGLSLNCNGHGTCSDTSGTAVCVCSGNWDPATNCSTCGAGYHDSGGTCVQDQTCLSGSCGGHGTCTTPGGVVTCSCDLGYDGQFCGACATNYQDKDSNGTCLMACTNPGLSLNCNGHGTCSDTSGTAVCVCNTNWDPATSCGSCLAGFQDNDNNGTCLPVCSSGTCNSHGTCSDTSGTATCTCNSNWNQADNCATCVSGFQDNDGNGTCLPVCPTSGACSSHGTCSDTSGTATCTCDTSFGGATCNTCDIGYIEYPTCFSYPGKAVVTPLTQVTTLINGANSALKFRIAAVGGPVWVSRMVFSLTPTGSASLSTIVLKRGATTIPYTTLGVGMIVFAFSPEEAVAVGTPIDYTFEVTVAGAVTGNTLTSTLRADTTLPAGLVGSTGYVYNSGGDSLFPSATGLCGTTGPNFVWSGATHTAPTPTCAITAVGDPAYTNGFEATWTDVTNVMTF